MKSKRVPIIALDAIAQASSDTHATALDAFLLDRRVEGVEATFGIPYRSNYYGVGICLKGEAEIAIDLEEFLVRPRTVIAMPPQAVKSWRSMTPDFEHIVIFFTRAYITERNALDPDRFSYFESGRHVLDLPETAAARMASVLRLLRERYGEEHPFRDDIVRASINVLLYDLEAWVRQQASVPIADSQEGRGKRLARDFKQLLRRHFMSERSVAFYAKTLCVTTRHLSATVREHTGKTAGDWIHEAVVLEARVLLRDEKLTIAQIADALHFPDQSSFGKFFKNLTGVSPLVYRKGVRGPLTF